MGIEPDQDSDAVRGSARLVLDASTIERMDPDHIDGAIWLEIDRRAFPASGWSDFPVRVLRWWVDALIPLMKGISVAVDVRFMDGPYAVEVAALGPNAWRVSAIDAGLTRRVRLSSTVDPRPLLASVIDSADSVLAICRAHGWEDSDSMNLASSLAALRMRSSPGERAPRPAMRFTMIPTASRGNEAVSLVYRVADHSFLARGPVYHGPYSVVVNYLELSVDERGTVTVVDGYAHQANWTPSDALPPPAADGQIRVLGLPPGLGRGMSTRLNPTAWWASHFNADTGWLCVGNPDPPASARAIRIATGALLVLDGEDLVAIWLPVTFEAD